MMLATKKNCQRVLAASLRVVSAMTGNPPLILSKLYKVLLPANHRARDRLYQIPHCQKRSYLIVVLIGLKISVNVVNRPMGFLAISASAAGMCNISNQSLCFKSIINSFDILALSEHCLLEEQHSLPKTATDGAYNYRAASSCDNPCIASGQWAHGGVALLWRCSINDFVTPIENIDSCSIVDIKYELNGIKPLFILSVYLSSSSYTTEEYRECLDLLWSLCDALSVDGYPIVPGDLNGDLGNSLGEKGTKEPNERGRLLLNFADYFNGCPVNLLSLCEGPLVTYNSFCGKYRSTIDYIFLPNCLQDKIIFARTFDFNVDNTSDHQLIIMKLNYHSNGVQLSADRDSVSNLKQKISWSKFNQAFIQANYVAPPLSEIALIDPVDLNHTDKLSEFITTIILKSSLSLVTPGTTDIKKRKHRIHADGCHH